MWNTDFPKPHSHFFCAFRIPKITPFVKFGNFEPKSSDIFNVEIVIDDLRAFPFGTNHKTNKNQENWNVQKVKFSFATFTQLVWNDVGMSIRLQLKVAVKRYPHIHSHWLRTNIVKPQPRNVNHLWSGTGCVSSEMWITKLHRFLGICHSIKSIVTKWKTSLTFFNNFVPKILNPKKDNVGIVSCQVIMTFW